MNKEERKIGSKVKIVRPDFFDNGLVGEVFAIGHSKKYPFGVKIELPKKGTRFHWYSKKQLKII